MTNPLVLITMGDPAGIGPETIAGAWRDYHLHAMCRAVVAGHPGLMRRAAALFPGELIVEEISSPEEARPAPNKMPVLSCGPADAVNVAPARIDPIAGRAAYDAVQLAAELALAGRVDAITTAPLNKAALHAAGFSHPGHTELLADFCGADDVAMMLYLSHGENVRGPAGLGVVHVTLHCALREVFGQLTAESIVNKTRAADVVMRALMDGHSPGEGPRIGICALNPHAGEQGLFGSEEQEIIQPAVELARAEGLSVVGPLPADTLLMRAVAGEFDAVVAMYHDQGHIALKTIGMHRAVNITLGLPIIRTSVAHGTAFDLAWQGRAETQGMIESVRVAASLVKQRDRLCWRAKVATGS